MKSLIWKEQFMQGNLKPVHISCTQLSPQKWIFERLLCCVFDIFARGGITTVQSKVARPEVLPATAVYSYWVLNRKPLQVTSSILKSQVPSLEMDTEGKRNKKAFEERGNIQKGEQ